MGYAIVAGLCAGGLFLAMLLMVEVGRRLGRRRRRGARGAQLGAPGAEPGVGVVDGAVFALLGLLLAFTFSGAVSRFDDRRRLIVEEANAIGTAYLRVDLLPAPAQPALRDTFRRYVDSRLDVYRAFPDVDAVRAKLAASALLQNDIWRQAVSAAERAGSPAASMLMVPALNAMIDLTTTRIAATRVHPPVIIFVMLFGLALASALLAGYGMASADDRPWVHMVGLAATLALTVYVILDVEFPRYGLIRVDDFDDLLVDVRNSMK